MTIDVAEVKRRLQTLLNDSNLVNEYIRQYGPSLDIKNIKAVKDKRAKAAREGDEEGGQDPLFDIKLRCPVCNRDEITCFELRAKSQAIVLNKFLVPTYKGASGYRTLDYTLYAVTVCPRCLFASPDKKDFSRAAPGSLGAELKSQLTNNVIMTLQEKIGERKALLRYIADYESFFRNPRTDDAAIVSYRLAMSRAKVEDWFEQPYSLYKLGAYALRIAKIMKDAGGDNREALREALNYFEEAFRVSNCPSEEIEMQVIYTVVALYLKLGDQRKANSYIGVFKNLRTTRQQEIKSNPKLTTVLIDKSLEKAAVLWDYRDEPDYFKNE
jgi:uncharacterized protein (DUF2225 family)